MIAGQINPTALREDQSAKSSSARQTPGFDLLLRPSHGALRDRDTPRTQSRETSDPIQRNVYGKDRRDTSQSDDSAGQGSPAQSAAATPVQEKPTHRSVDMAEEQPDAAIAEAAMTHTNPQPVGLAAGQPSPMVQLGAASYQSSPHGVSEFAFAEEAGLFPPGYAAPKPVSIGAQGDALLDGSTFQQRTLPEAEVVEPNKGLSAVEVLNLSRRATDRTTLADEALMEQQTKPNPFSKSDVLQSTSSAQPQQQATAQAYLSQLLNQEFQDQAFRDAPRAPVRSGIAEYARPTGIDGAALSTQITPTGTPGAAGIGAFVADAAAEDNAARMVDRIADQARWIIRNNRQEVTMKLHPEHLGDMRLKVVRTDKLMRVDMTVETLGAKQMLDSSLDDLLARLQAENPATENFEFNVDVRQGNDPRQSEAFVMPARDAMATERQEQSDSVRAQETLVNSRPRWGTRGSGIYA